MHHEVIFNDIASFNQIHIILFITMQEYTFRLELAHILLVLALLFGLVPGGTSLTSPQIMAPTNHFINISSYVFDTTTTYGTKALNFNPFTFNFVFTYVHPNTGYHVGLSIGQINYVMPPSRLLNYTVSVSGKLTTGIGVNIYANTANKIKKFIINILIIQAGFVDYSFYYLSLPSGSSFTQGQSFTKTSTIATSVPTNSPIYNSIIGIDLLASSTTFEIGFSISCVMATSTSVNITVTSISPQSTTLNYIYINYFVYSNSQLAAVSPAGLYTLGSFSSTGANNAALFWNFASIRTYNTFIGLSAFYIKGDTFFDYMTSVNGLSATATSTNKWLKLAFSVVVFEFYYCPDATPYLMLSNNTCYDICPARYCSNGSNFRCNNCPTYDCYYCGINGKCTVCNDTIDFRYMDNTTMRCLPLPGYYDNGVSQAVPCVAANCLTCTTATRCLSCYPGKFLSGTTCLNCMVYCINCTASTSCITCTTYYIYSGSACVPNCSNITYCMTCTVSEGIICSTCTTGYSVVNNTCIVVCGDGMMMTPETCDDNNTLSGDGCSSTCKIETAYFCNVAVSPSACSPCMVNCDNCTSATVCTVCSAGYVIAANSICVLDCSVIAFCATCQYNSSLAGTQCLTAQTGYYVQSNNTCASICGDGIRVAAEGCDDGNANSTDGCSSSCTVESGFFCTDIFPNASVCSRCLSFCSICSNNVSCSNCSTGYSYNTSQTACTIDCSLIAQCLTCDFNGTTQCLTCATGFYLDNATSTCGSRCGDGIKVTSEGCDDGNTNSTDGCSSSCTVENYYFCTDTFPNASVCLQCLSFCQICSNNVSCSNCSTGYSYNTSQTACTIDCSPIVQCLTCDFNGTTQCLTCVTGFYVDNATNTCGSRCGDGIRVAAEGCDDGNANSTDGCSSSCTVESGFFCTDIFPNASVCSRCLSFCSICSNNVSCSNCSTGYSYNTSQTACTIDCSLIAQCLTCDFNGTTQCLTCVTGFYVDNTTNTCVSRCGDGIRVAAESCDDGNANSTDGCSSNCTIEAAFYCVDTAVSTNIKSICSACLSFCISCTNASSCLTCQANYTYNSTTPACVIYCTPIALCVTCDFPGFLNCLSCSLGYYPVSNICQPRCGDGILVASEACDDGNTNNNDGCSSACTLEQSFLCTNNTVNGTEKTNCVPCLANCIDCAGNVDDCLQCKAGYIYKASGVNVTCDIDCAVFLDCTACTFSACTACSSGYFLNKSKCSPICGDGVVMMGEPCDDGNLLSGDGCDAFCQLEVNFQCLTIDVISVCSLLSMSVTFVSLDKIPTANSINIAYLIAPASLPAFSKLDWRSVVYQQSNLSVTFTGFTFDNTSGQLSISADYSQPLDTQMLQIGFNFPPAAPFSMLNATNTSTLLVASNNLALQVYSDEEYGQAQIVGYVAMALAGASIFLFLLGYLSGKLVGLECVTVFQLTFLSLITCDKLSASFYGLSFLGYSCGYSLRSLQSSSINIGKRFRPLGQSEPFINNYNLTSILVFLPLVLSLILTIINRIRYRSTNQFLLKHSQLLRGEGCFYGLMFSAYTIILALGIEITNMGSGMIGLAIGAILLLAILFFGFLLHRFPEIFGQFTQKFGKQSCIQSHYYCILIFERILMTGCLIMAFFNPQGGIIIAILAVQIIIVLWRKPYAGERAYLRPFLNLLISALIQVVFIMTPTLSTNKMFAQYSVFIILGLLAMVLIYNLYYFIKQFRGTPIEKSVKAVEEEENLMKQEFSKLEVFQQKLMMDGAKISMLDKSMTLQSSDPDSPTRLTGNMLNGVRDQLNKVKITTDVPDNISLEGGLDIVEEDAI